MPRLRDEGIGAIRSVRTAVNKRVKEIMEVAEGPDVDLRLGAATVARPELLPMPYRPSAEQHQCQDDQYKAHGYKVDRDRDGIDAAHGRRWQLWIIYRQLHLLFVLPPREVSPFNSTPRRQ